MTRAILVATIYCLFTIPSHADIIHCDDRGCRPSSGVQISQSYTPSESRVLGSRPAGCPSRWCGCWLGLHVGMTDKALWRAINWARVGRPAKAQPGAIVVWRNHVGKVTAVDGNRIKVLSGNDGKRVRERWRTMAGVVAFRVL